LNTLILKAHKAGLQISVHAIGDRAIEVIIKAYSEAFKNFRGKTIDIGLSTVLSLIESLLKA
jgi:predicted amidohydrolase YtcJ